MDWRVLEKSLCQDPCWPWRAVHHGCVRNETTRLEQQYQLSVGDQGSGFRTWETGSVDGMATGAVGLRTNIPTLNHHLKIRELSVSGRKHERDGWHTNLRDDAVEGASPVAESAFSS